MAGRKSKLTKELIEEAEQLLKLGVFNTTVCDYLGISQASWYSWLKDGEQAKSGLKAELFDRVKKAEAHAEIRNVKIIQEAAKENWTASGWFLERKYPKKWGRRQEVEMKGEMTQTIKDELDLSKLSVEEIEQLEKIYEKLYAIEKTESAEH